MGCVGNIEVAKRIIMSAKPTQPLSQDTAVSVTESPPRGFLHLLTVCIVRQRDEYFYALTNKREYDSFYASGEGLWFAACVPEVMYRNAIIRHRIHHFVVTAYHHTSICFRQMG